MKIKVCAIVFIYFGLTIISILLSDKDKISLISVFLLLLNGSFLTIYLYIMKNYFYNTDNFDSLLINIKLYIATYVLISGEFYIQSFMTQSSYVFYLVFLFCDIWLFCELFLFCRTMKSKISSSLMIKETIYSKTTNSINDFYLDENINSESELINNYL